MPGPDAEAKQPFFRHPSVGAALVNGVFFLLGIVLTAVLARQGLVPGQPVATPTETATVTVTPTETATVTVTPTATATPDPEELRPGEVLLSRESTSIRIPAYTELDLDPGAPNWPVQDDGRTDIYVTGGIGGWGDGEIGYFGTTEPSYHDCLEFTAYSGGRVDSSRVQADRYLCVQTDEDRVGYIKIVDPNPDEKVFDVVVWAKSEDVT